MEDPMDDEYHKFGEAVGNGLVWARHLRLWAQKRFGILVTTGLLSSGFMVDRMHGLPVYHWLFWDKENSRYFSMENSLKTLISKQDSCFVEIKKTQHVVSTLVEVTGAHKKVQKALEREREDLFGVMGKPEWPMDFPIINTGLEIGG